MTAVPNVLFAIQAPTLLNILAQSRSWNMTVANLGDTAGLDEVKLLQVPRYKPGTRVDHVFVCSPKQHENARKLFSRSCIWWVLHTGPAAVQTPSGDHRTLVFSERVKLLHAGRNPQLKLHAVTPAYEENKRWEWTPGVAWAMRNRPKTRNSEALANLMAVGSSANEQFTCYGQGWPSGFLMPEKVEALRRSCSAYVSALPKWAGFGLAEHECFAAGVPVVGSRWGDMDAEMPKDYWALVDGIAEQQTALQRVLRDREGAERLSALGLDFIREHRSMRRMDESIAAALANG